MTESIVIRKGLIIAILFSLISVSIMPNSIGKNNDKRLRSDSPNIPPKVEWNRLYTTHEFYESTWVEHTNEGGYIILGRASRNIWMIKTDGIGHEQWSRTIQGDEPIIGQVISQTTDGGYIIIGGTATIHGQYNNSLLIKTDIEGNELWSKIFGGSQRDLFLSGQQTNDSGYILAGDTRSFGSKNDSQIWLLKTDESGTEQWNTTYGNGSGNSIQQTTDSGYIIVGTAPGNKTFSDIFLLKTDFYGKTQWKKTYGGSNWDLGHSVQQTSDGGYIIFGISYRDIADGHAVSLLIKTDSQGNEVWNKTFRKGENDDIQGYCVRQTNDDGYILTGTQASFSIPGWYNLWLLRTDTNGNILWERTFDSGDKYGDRGKVVQQIDDGGYIMVGDSAEDAIWLIKLSAETPLKNTFLIGRTSTSTFYENYSILYASRICCFQLFPLKIRYFHSGEEIIVSNDYKGTLTNTTIFGVFMSHI